MPAPNPAVYYHVSGNAPAAATTEIVPASGVNTKVVVHSYAEQCGAVDTDSTWKSGATPISGLHANLAKVGRVCGWNPQAWFETAENEALNLTNGAGSAVGYEVVYSVQQKDA